MIESEPPESEDSLLSGVVTAAELSHKEFPDLVEHVPRLVMEGFGILAGPPKLGKSWFTLVIALAVAAGGYAFGKLKVDKRPVLLLALEDSERRLQSRIKVLHGNEIPPHLLHIITRVQPGLLLPTMTAWLEHHPDGLVVLDTLGRARQQRRPGADPYLEDYRAGSALKSIVDAFPGSALLGVSHTRKQSSDDFVDDISGTLGLAGSADYLLILRRKRQSEEATLQVTGRDAPEGEYAFTVTGGQWILSGNALEDAAAEAISRRNATKLGDRSLDVLGLVNRRKETRAADLAEIGMNQHQARTYLSRLAEQGRITKHGRGAYKSVASVASVASDGNAQVIDLFGKSSNATVDAESVASENAATSENNANATHATNATPVCTSCSAVLTSNNQTGRCAECDYITRQTAIAQRLDELNPPTDLNGEPNDQQD